MKSQPDIEITVHIVLKVRAYIFEIEASGLTVFMNFFKGLEHSWTRHQSCAEQLHAGLEKLGLRTIVRNPVST